MPNDEYPRCSCFSEEKHGPNWEEILLGKFSKREFRKVRQGTGCTTCKVKRYTSEASRCKRCEIIKSYLSCKHRRPEQLVLFEEA